MWRIYRVVFTITRQDGTKYTMSEEFHAHGEMEATRTALSKCSRLQAQYGKENVKYYCYAC